MRKIILMILLSVMLLTSCAMEDAAKTAEGYRIITAQEAKEIMDTREDYILLDVRTQSEYDAGHIPGAILIPNTEIAQRAEQELPNKDQLILIYCRSGNRSKQAAKILADMGYTDVREFGGIRDWPYDVE